MESYKHVMCCCMIHIPSCFQSFHQWLCQHCQCLTDWTAWQSLQLQYLFLDITEKFNGQKYQERHCLLWGTLEFFLFFFHPCIDRFVSVEIRTPVGHCLTNTFQRYNAHIRSTLSLKSNGSVPSQPHITLTLTSTYNVESFTLLFVLLIKNYANEIVILNLYNIVSWDRQKTPARWCAEFSR